VFEIDVSVWYNNMVWRQTSLIARVHRGVGRFDMFGEKLGIE
jgi:hypothetical protein